MKKKEMFKKCYIKLSAKRPPDLENYWILVWHPIREQLLYWKSSEVVRGWKERKKNPKLRKKAKEAVTDENLIYVIDYWMPMVAPKGKEVNPCFNLKKCKVALGKTGKKKKRRTLL